MRTRIWGTILAAIVVIAGQAAAQDEWTKKPYQEWTKAEAEKVLNDSPWVARQEVRLKREKQVQSVAGAPSTNTGIGGPALIKTEQNSVAVGGAQAPIDFVFTLRLRSALPVREALARLKQLEAKEGKLDKKELANLDARLKGLVECPACAENYVLSLSSKSKENPGADAVYTVFGGAKEADIKRYLYIANDKGERRTLVHFVPPRAPGEEALFFFPRLDEKGAPLLTPESKTLIFNVTNGEVNNIVNFRINVNALRSGDAIQF